MFNLVLKRKKPTKIFSRIDELIHKLHYLSGFKNDVLSVSYIAKSSICEFTVSLKSNLGPIILNIQFDYSDYSHYIVNYYSGKFDSNKWLWKLNISEHSTIVFPKLIQLKAKDIDLALHEIETIIGEQFNKIQAEELEHSKQVKLLEE